MQRTACLIGNSSSGIREGAFIGTPVVNVGTRQHARQRGANVIDVSNNKDSIINAVKQHLTHGAYCQDPIYGDGYAGDRIANVLAGSMPMIQKTITY